MTRNSNPITITRLRTIMGRPPHHIDRSRRSPSIGSLEAPGRLTRTITESTLYLFHCSLSILLVVRSIFLILHVCLFFFFKLHLIGFKLFKKINTTKPQYMLFEGHTCKDGLNDFK